MKQIFLLILVCFALYLPGFFSLPPIDRDEARFAQSSKQMVESGNYIDIRFQDQPRYKKPIGVYWLQALSANATGRADAIWSYRIPSLMAAILSVLIIFWFGCKILDRKRAFISALLLSASILMIVEAHLAKTDALLLLSVIVTQSSLGIIYLESKPNILHAVILWISLGAGILIKGPIAPLISILTIVTLAIVDKRRSAKSTWLKNLYPIIGIPILLLIITPWFLAINKVSGGTFWSDSVGKDLVTKIVSAQESHGFPPGFYLLLFPILFFPGSLFLFKNIKSIWGKRESRVVTFLLSWIIPSWIFFELMPTKLPHYILPIIPAAALLVGASINEVKIKKIYHSVGILIVALWISLELILPRVEKLWLSREIAEVVTNSGIYNTNTHMASFGYSEPSLVFLLGKDLALLKKDELENFYGSNANALVIIKNDNRDYFKRITSKMHKPAILLGTVEGLNYSKGRWLTMDIYASKNAK